MIQLSPADLARVKSLTDSTYKFLHEDVRLYMNEQLLEASSYYEYTDWLERMETIKSHYLDGPVNVSARPARAARTQGD